MYEIIYKGKGVSWNHIYGSNNWGVRKGIVDKYKKIFFYLLKEAKVGKLEQYTISVIYKSRHDCDNVGAMVKLMLDALKQGYAPDDSPKYLKQVIITYDESLENNTFKFQINDWDDSSR